MSELKIKMIENKSYAEITTDAGYCFYDVLQKEKIYMTKLITPNTNSTELKNRYILVAGDANILNQQKENEE